MHGPKLKLWPSPVLPQMASRQEIPYILRSQTSRRQCHSSHFTCLPCPELWSTYHVSRVVTAISAKNKVSALQPGHLWAPNVQSMPLVPSVSSLTHTVLFHEPISRSCVVSLLITCPSCVLVPLKQFSRLRTLQLSHPQNSYIQRSLILKVLLKLPK